MSFKINVPTYPIHVPSIPEDILAEFPYISLLQIDSYSNGEYVSLIGYLLVASKEKQLYAPPAVTASAEILASSAGNVVGGQWSLYIASGSFSWGSPNEVTNAILCNLGLTTITDESDQLYQTLIWSNHDIMCCSEKTISDNTSWLSTGLTPGTDIHFSKSNDSRTIELPDIPADVAETYAFKVVVGIGQNNATTYGIGATLSEVIYAPAEITGASYGVISTIEPGYALLTCCEGDDAWTSADSSETNATQLPIGVANGNYVLLWSNHDVLTMTGVDENGMAVIGTDIYFKSSIFRLPDGTELPALPEGCFEQRPYGFITAGYQNGQLIGCALHTGFDIADYTENVLAGQQINALVCHAPNFMSYEYEVGVDTTWKAGIEDTSGDGMMAVVGTNGDMSIGVAWSNFDIFYLDNVDDEGNRVLSDTLYHKSDVNYRIYGGWLNSMGNQARRLGNVSGALKPGEMETVFKGMPPNYGGIPSETIYFTKQLNPGSSVECPEIPSITDSGGMYIILFNNDDIKGVHSCVYVVSGTRFSSVAMSEYISLQLIDGTYILNNASTNGRDEIACLCMIVPL